VAAFFALCLLLVIVYLMRVWLKGKKAVTLLIYFVVARLTNLTSLIRFSLHLIMSKRDGFE
jgi:hypothetical protein